MYNHSICICMYLGVYLYIYVFLWEIYLWNKDETSSIVTSRYYNTYIIYVYVMCVRVWEDSMCVCVTFRWLQQFVVLRTPAHRMQLCSHDVTPEVSAALVIVATVAQQQQLATCCDDGSNPVCVSATPIGHLQLHPSLETALQAQLHLNRPNAQFCMSPWEVGRTLFPH